MPRIRAIASDIDGTLYPFTSVQLEGWKERSHIFVRDLLSLTDGSEVALAARYLDEHGSVLSGLKAEGHDVDPQAFFDDVHDVSFIASVSKNPELAAAFRAEVLPKFAFTNADIRHAMFALTQVGVLDAFARLIHIETMGLRGKPHPDAFDTLIDHVRDELGTSVQPDEIVILEDSLRNIRAAKQIQMRTMHVRHGIVLDDPSIDVAIDVINDFRQGMDELMAKVGEGSR